MRGWIAIYIALLFFLLCPSSSGVFTCETSGTTAACDNGQQTVHANGYTPHGSITIASNADFASQAWPGSGIENSPYVIEGLNITDDYECINIADTTVYFEIRNCLISAPIPHDYDGHGVSLVNVTHGLLEGCVIERHSYGVWVSWSDCSVTGNTITDSRYGVFVWHANCSVTGNIIVDCIWDGISLGGGLGGCNVNDNTLEGNGLSLGISSSSDWFSDIDNNTVNGKPLGCFRLLNDTSIDGDLYGQVILLNCSRVTVSNGAFIEASIGIALEYCVDCSLVANTLMANARYGVRMAYSQGCTLTGNTATNNGQGFTVAVSEEITLTDNFASGSENGVFLHLSDHCILTDNTAINNTYGLQVYESHYNILTGNTAIGNEVGLMVSESDHCTVMGNTATENMRGISLRCCAGIGPFLNRLFNNTEFNGYDTREFYPPGTFAKSWDNGTHGNIWGDYDGSGPYLIPGNAESRDGRPYLFESVSPGMYHSEYVEYEYGTTGHYISWGTIESWRYYYYIYRNGTLIAEGGWHETTINISIDGLDVGVYNYTLVIYDASGNSASGTIMVAVAYPTTTTSTTTETTEPGSIDPMLFMIGAGVAVGVVVVVIVIVRSRK